jgi:hypothetical protein
VLFFVAKERFLVSLVENVDGRERLETGDGCCDFYGWGKGVLSGKEVKASGKGYSIDITEKGGIV